MYDVYSYVILFVLWCVMMCYNVYSYVVWCVPWCVMMCTVMCYDVYPDASRCALWCGMMCILMRYDVNSDVLWYFPWRVMMCTVICYDVYPDALCSDDMQINKTEKLHQLILIFYAKVVETSCIISIKMITTCEILSFTFQNWGKVSLNLLHGYDPRVTLLLSGAKDWKYDNLMKNFISQRNNIMYFDTFSFN